MSWEISAESEFPWITRAWVCDHCGKFSCARDSPIPHVRSVPPTPNTVEVHYLLYVWCDAYDVSFTKAWGHGRMKSDRHYCSDKCVESYDLMAVRLSVARIGATQ